MSTQGVGQFGRGLDDPRARGLLQRSERHHPDRGLQPGQPRTPAPPPPAPSCNCPSVARYSARPSRRARIAVRRAPPADARFLAVGHVCRSTTARPPPGQPSSPSPTSGLGRATRSASRRTSAAPPRATAVLRPGPARAPRTRGPPGPRRHGGRTPRSAASLAAGRPPGGTATARRCSSVASGRPSRRTAASAAGARVPGSAVHDHAPDYLCVSHE